MAVMPSLSLGGDTPVMRVEMTLNQYQNRSWNAGYPRVMGMGILYCALKLNGEAGEVAEKVGKTLRDNNGEFTWERKDALKHELGDALWYISALAKELGYTLEDIAQANIDKVTSRIQRGVLNGEGDNR